MMAASSARTERYKIRGISLIELLVVIALLGLLVMMAIPGLQAAREAARRTQCGNNVRQQTIAILNFASTAGDRLPSLMATVGAKQPQRWWVMSDGQAPIAWRYSILPYLEEESIQRLLREAYVPHLAVSDAHVSVRPLGIATFVCPSVPTERTDHYLRIEVMQPLEYDGFGVSDYAAISYVNDQVPGIAAAAGAFYGRGRINLDHATEDQRQMARLAYVRDGLSKTILLGERVDQTNWMQGWITKWPFDNLSPRTARINDSESGLALASVHPGGVYVSMCDGHVKFLDESTDALVYEALLTRRGNAVTRALE